jgi:flagellar biosynthesis/type III secretory pathway M-ring protein FliF/YscJ
MDPQNIPQNYQMPPSEPQSMSPIVTSQKKMGPIIAIAVAVVVIIAVAIYMFSSRYTVVNPTTQTTETGANVNNAVVEQNVPSPEAVMPITNTKDDIDSLQKDLDTSIDGLESSSI